MMNARELITRMKGGASSMATIEPYRPPQAATAFPLRLDVNGATYVLAQGDGHQVQTLTQHPAAPVGPVVSGVQYAMTAEGYRPLHEAQAQGYAPYHADSGHPPWLRNHYTRGTGILIGAGAIGTVLFIVAAALYAIVVWALANIVAIGVVIVVIFAGVMILLGGITKTRHGHKPGR